MLILLTGFAWFLLVWHRFVEHLPSLLTLRARLYLSTRHRLDGFGKCVTYASRWCIHQVRPLIRGERVTVTVGGRVDVFV